MQDGLDTKPTPNPAREPLGSKFYVRFWPIVLIRLPSLNDCNTAIAVSHLSQHLCNPEKMKTLQLPCLESMQIGAGPVANSAFRLRRLF